MIETKEYRDVIDKSKWGEGPWQTEPDKKQWTDEATGLPCLIVRNRMGALCGYVGVPPSHPAYGKDYNDVNADAHGGLTFADKCQPGDEPKAICHVAPPGEDDVWWLGFDCAHGGDLVPEMSAMFKGMRAGQGTYRDFEYVTNECRNLAASLS